ncbi:MAG: NAD(P)-dependent oxidoreductase [Acidobacteriota bacterium]
MKIAFLGLGAMGYPMASHLVSNHEVVVWNRTAAVAEKHAAEFGTTAASSLAECSGAEVIITILPTSREVDEVVDRLWPDLRAGLLWLDMTSGDPGTSRATARRLETKGIHFVDAPVSGGIPGAENGTLTVMAGGSDQDFAMARDLIAAFATKIVHVGETGTGHAIKALNNVLLGANLWLAAECLVTARKFGIEPARALEVINNGSGRSFVTESLLPSRIVDGKWPLVFKLALHDKDIRIASAMAHEQHVAAPILALTSQLFTAALQALGPDSDYIEVTKYAAGMSGEEW